MVTRLTSAGLVTNSSLLTSESTPKSVFTSRCGRLARRALGTGRVGIREKRMGKDGARGPMTLAPALQP